VPEIANVEQAAAWDGPSGAVWVAREERQNESLGPHTDALFEAVDIGTTDRVLDVGCGCGETTRMCARLAVDGHALGVDLSSAMLERARSRAAEEGIVNAEFVQADAQVHEFTPASFDLVVSRFGVMFFADPLAAFTNLGRAMAPGGRFAAMVWQPLAANEWMWAPRDALALGRPLPEPPVDAPGPFGLADPSRTRAILAAAGFVRVAHDDVDVPFRFGADADEAVEYARGVGLIRAALEPFEADVETMARALDALRAVMVEHESDDGVVFESRAWVVTAFR
jgi:SAM-dependent methyltransferase